LRWPGFWKMARRFWRKGFDEQYRSWVKSAFTGALQQLVPELTADDLVPGGSGVRAQAVDRNGNLLDDFYFVHSRRMIHVCNVPSPAATASLEIGREVVDKLANCCELGS
jgi:L-2-hydroxyglutarate oxidase LhgO